MTITDNIQSRTYTCDTDVVEQLLRNDGGSASSLKGVGSVNSSQSEKEKATEFKRKLMRSNDDFTNDLLTMMPKNRCCQP